METSESNLKIIANIVSTLMDNNSVEVSQKPGLGLVHDLKRILGEDNLVIVCCSMLIIDDIYAITTLLKSSSEKIILMDEIDKAIPFVAEKLRKISMNNKVIFRSSL